MEHPFPDEPGFHDEAEALLPWYTTGQLQEAERVMVEQHLSRCAECREQLKLERRMVQQFRSLEPQVDSGWARLRSRIETQSSSAWAYRPNHRGLRNFFQRPVVAIAAAIPLGLLLFAAGMLLSLSRPTYHALGSGPTAASANVIVIFRAGATVEDIRDALHASGASIVGGPTAADAYLLRVPAKQRQSALEKLKSDNQVELAEPVDGAAQ